jgi:hypothetical protein
MSPTPRSPAQAVLLALVALPMTVLAQSATPPSAPGTPAPVAADLSDSISIRVPAGLESKAPLGVDMTQGLPESVQAGAVAEAGEPGRGEWVIVPIPFKSALLGAGLQLGVGRLYQPLDKPAQSQASMFGVGGMYAEGGSWAAVAADRRFWGTGAVRSTLAGGVGEIRYAINLSGIFRGLELPVTQTFTGGTLELGYEARKHLWLSAGLKIATSEITIKGLELDGGDRYLLLPAFTYDIALVSLKAEWDSRSDQFYPTDGSLVKAEANLADTALGSNTNYQIYDLSYNGYKAINEHHTLAWRVAGKTAAGAPPFFALPWYGSGVDLRGYAPGTYIGKSLLAAQAEWRWQATHRIGVVAFGGLGGVWGEAAPFDQDSFLPAGGLGLRWRLTDKFRVNFRIDYAWGKDDEVLLISAGEAF